LQSALHRAVLAVAAVQRDEAAREALALQFAQLALRRIEGIGIDALALQRIEHAGAGHQAHFALGAGAAHQHRNLAERFHVHAHDDSLLKSATFAATPPIEPAPIAITTSPSRDWSRIVAGNSATSSTNTGSTLPATRSARASERPSAATIGASPAAYTSVSSTASAEPITLTKSSKQSRVRV